MPGTALTTGTIRQLLYNRLQPENLVDFTGGLNYSTDQFSLATNETPDLLNIDLDPRSGFSTRRGWQRWNTDEIADVTPWQPRNAVVHTEPSGDQIVFVVNDGVIYAAPESATFTPIVGPVAQGTPHDADFVSWGSDVYVSCGMLQPSYRIDQTMAATALAADSWSEVDAPVVNSMPHAEYCEAHAGYLFVGCTVEAGVNHFTRIRWSHPNRPDAWRTDDFLDIDAYGGKITALLSFRDHLLIFKTTSMWALYGYDDGSWQLVLVSSSIGCPTITAITKSETTVFFFSASNKNGIYAYAGSDPTYISDNLRPAMREIVSFDNVFVSWANRKLWVSVPWFKGQASLDPQSVFIFDQNVGQGAWTQYAASSGAIASVVDGSDINAKFPLAAFWSTQAATMVVLDVIDDAYDKIVIPPSLGALPDAYITTHADEEIEVNGSSTQQSFETYYRTPWMHGGSPDVKKSFRRPMFICRRTPHRVDLLVLQYRDYDEVTIRRTGLVPGVADDIQMWSDAGSGDPNGADWGGGARWGAQVQGASMSRGGPMGHCVALQMKVTPAPDTLMRKWGVDGIVVKTVSNRLRT